MTLVLLALLLQAPAVLESSVPTAVTNPSHVVPAGTVLPVNLTSRLRTKHAKEGDGIYAQTIVPIVVNDEIVIPAGSFVRGKVSHVQQPGRIKGRAELTLSFQHITLPTGPSFEIYASLGGTGGT